MAEVVLKQAKETGINSEIFNKLNERLSFSKTKQTKHEKTKNEKVLNKKKETREQTKKRQDETYKNKTAKTNKQSCKKRREIPRWCVSFKLQM